MSMTLCILFLCVIMCASLVSAAPVVKPLSMRSTNERIAVTETNVQCTVVPMFGRFTLSVSWTANTKNTMAVCAPFLQSDFYFCDYVHDVPSPDGTYDWTSLIWLDPSKCALQSSEWASSLEDYFGQPVTCDAMPCNPSPSSPTA
ncbi:uncharacterized protein BJ171DRAFT_619542 [Polychytrium aggregatum]|uniref:uncharacterized protein n=1 Tax=Polychytrium aggregatum TaxID=110093 RepID=UPI0022FF296A|nr:uncharacterized protein BJ171DRAFT_619542 [Polychytrium aggregatum]KAI9204368.1 hypothetical protein BJ171DRAFT_619542 [Polychytrium aggregatum]